MRVDTLPKELEYEAVDVFLRWGLEDEVVGLGVCLEYDQKFLQSAMLGRSLASENTGTRSS